MKLTLQALLNEGAQKLARSGIEEAELDAKYLLFEAFHTDLMYFLLHRNDEIGDGDLAKRAAAKYRKTLEKRSERTPLSQITGSREFMGLKFCVNENVLIPRQDTETLVELVLKDFAGKDPKILDLGAGSGCIGISLAVLGGFSDVTLADISAKALVVAKKNVRSLVEKKQNPVRFSSDLAEKRPQKITLAESDLFSSFSGRRKFDVIVSNPPYIPTDMIWELEPEVKDHEPRRALDGMNDGLYYYRRLAQECGDHLKPGGTVYFEIGYDQGSSVSGLLRDAGFKGVTVYKDAPGLDRVVKGVMVPPCCNIVGG